MIATIALYCILTVTNQPTIQPDKVDRWLDALGQVESGNRDRARGRNHEVSRYQIRPLEWRAFTSRTPIGQAVNPTVASRVAKIILESRIAGFIKRYHRAPTDQQVYLLWHRPNRVIHPRMAEAERAQRFANLMETP